MISSAFGSRFSRFSRLGGRALIYWRRHGTRAMLQRAAFALGLGRAAEMLGYPLWSHRYVAVSESDRQAMRRHLASFRRAPTISLIVSLDRPNPVWLRRTLESAINQVYPHWQLCIVHPPATEPAVLRLLAKYEDSDARVMVVQGAAGGDIAAAANRGLVAANGDFVAFLGQHDLLAEQALYVVAASLETDGPADLLYSDEDRVDATGSRTARPFFKPDWNLDQFEGQNYLADLCVLRRSLVTEVGGCSAADAATNRYDLLLRAVDRSAPEAIRHLPMVLYHRRQEADPSEAPGPAEAPAAAAEALRGHVARRGLPASVVFPTSVSSAGSAMAPSAPGWVHGARLRYPLPGQPPRVSVIVPTRDGLAMLRQCVDGLLGLTDYPDLEIIVVDNGSAEPATLAYLDEIGRGPVRVLRYDAPFNYSAINNFAVRHASGSVLALLNNDIKMIHADWLAEMVSQALRPDVGAVGAKLYYADDTLQHAGVVTGMGGVAGHVHVTLPKDRLGNHGDVRVVREVACATAACLVLRREVFEAVGGLDEERLTVAFNDVDLCLKIRAHGWRILWTPYAELYHLESATRGADDSPAKRARFAGEIRTMEQRWGATLTADPFYSPNLSLENGRCELAFPPRLEKPWLVERPAAPQPAEAPAER